jgi:glycopeptide antibiotics resistance protein
MIPFGFGLPFVARLKFKGIVIAGIYSILLIETMQLVSGLIAGGTFRVVDINDVIFNTIGVVLGYALFVMFIRMVRFGLDKLSVQRNAILEYIYERPQIATNKASAATNI